MADVVVKIEGLRELEQALAELPKATAKATLRRTLKKAAGPVRDAWRQNVTPYRETGHYEDSIIEGTKLTRRQSRAAKKEGKAFSETYVGTSDPAALQDEFGNFRQSARAPGRKAWAETQDGALTTISDDLGNEIEKSRARLARKAAKLAGGG
ncbi:HK97 gp10 family phage protein [Sphingomonas sp. ZT3P38]|uniref:HK97 gp10 family phage protein n=1 Tax=Parasphingomonas zepuensis TaxID=3096161 RepID=UPI002FC8BF0E